MSEKNGADTDCALFIVAAKGYAGSYGAAIRCIESPCPEGFREDIWDRLKKWSARTIKRDEESGKTGSIHEALWNIGKEGYGFKINIRDIPLEQEAVEISEALGLNIFDLESAGLDVSVFTSYTAEKYNCIGYATRGRDKFLVNGDEISYLNRPPLK